MVALVRVDHIIMYAHRAGRRAPGAGQRIRRSKVAYVSSKWVFSAVDKFRSRYGCWWDFVVRVGKLNRAK